MNISKLLVVVLAVMLMAAVVSCGGATQPTATPVPATNTPLPIPTDTPVPPPPTATPIPPTPTPVPPTPTPIPPTPTPVPPAVLVQLNCQDCHNDIHTTWSGGPHANTQADVATELASERSGQTPDEVLHGEDAENCIACHGPTAILAAGGMTETQALKHFFTVTDGKFGADTATANTDVWPNITCIACHRVPGGHPASKPTLFDSPQGKYASLHSASEACGQCHGNLRFAGTDHLTYNAWTTSKHSKTQADVASELGEERAGQSAEDVVKGEDPENCIACHAPTAVLTNGRLSETQALEYFFTTADGKFTADTAPAHSSDWPDVACNACHNPHNPKQPAYFNSATKQYEPMQNTNELCGQCHGNLRFPDTDHLSYNIIKGTGGIGVPGLKTQPGARCIDCHMFVSDKDGSKSSMFHGHSWAITVKEDDGTITSSCSHCHTDEDQAKLLDMIPEWQSDFRTLDATAQENVTAAVAAMKGIGDKALQTKLEEAQHNLGYAESDESGGFHNHKYVMLLLKDANDRALEILSALKK
ncbi:MAG: ammonia-forming cytochrome c nitrite reductase subunit c552 [Chloroflexi bacterium]|nr:ammonia-forming cytochrome c nitrite reductase subunit c552 [Chloroflexota bacterium]